MTSILLGTRDFPDGYRLEFHQKNDRVIAKLYQGNSKRGTHHLEGVSAEQWGCEPITDIVQTSLNRFLNAHGVRLDPERVTVGRSQEFEVQVGAVSIVNPTLSNSPFTRAVSLNREIDSHKRKKATKSTSQEKGKEKVLRNSPFHSSSLNKSSPYKDLSTLPSSDSLVEISLPNQLISLESLEYHLIKLDYPQQELEVLLQTASQEQNKRIVVDALFQHLLALEHMPALDHSLVDVRNSQGYNLLLAAIALGDEAKFNAIFPLYKDHDALYAVDPYGRNALHLAAAFGHAALIPLLIEEGIATNATDQHGLMPLHWAIHIGSVAAIKALVTLGTSLVVPWKAPDSHQYSPLELAIVAGHPDVLSFLLTSDRFEYFDLAQSVQGRGSLLHLAICVNQAPMLKHLLSIHSEKTKPLFTHKDPQGRTPLQLAAYLGDAYAIHLLERHGADLSYGAGENEGTAVHYAADGEQPAAIELLYNLGAQLEQTNGQGKTPSTMLEGRNSVAARKCRGLLNRLPRMERVSQTSPPDYTKRPPLNLVIQGDGTRGLAYLGALEQIEKLKVLRELKRVAGTSSGAIIAALLAVGCTTTELKVYLEQFLDAEEELQGGFAAQQQSYREEVRALLIEYWSSQSTVLSPFNRGIQLKEKLQQLTNLASGDAMRGWIEGIIREKTGKEHCTFKELKGLIDREPEKYKELHIFSLCLIQGKQPQLIRFSHEKSKWDDLILSDAIRASLSIPGVFQPHILHFKDATGTRHPREHHGRFSGGGLLCHDSLTAFDAEKYQEVRYFRGEKTNRRTLGLSLSDETVYTEEELRTISSGPGLVKALVNTFYHAEQIFMEETGRYKDRTIEIPIQGIGLLDFPVAAETKEKLMIVGKEVTDQFFSSSILAQPSPKPKESVQVTRDQGIPWKYSIFYEFQPKIEETPEETLSKMLQGPCHHSNEPIRQALYPYFYRDKGYTNVNAAHAHVESHGTLTITATTNVYNTPLEIEELNQRLENVPQCLNCITDLMAQAREYLENSHTPSPEIAALYLATAFERCEQIPSSEQSQRVQALLEQAFRACRPPESQGLFPYFSLQYRNVSLISYMVSRDVSLMESKELDAELYQLLRQVFDSLIGEDLTGIRKHFYEKFYRALEERFAIKLASSYEAQLTNIYRSKATKGTWKISLPIKGVYTSLAILTEEEHRDKREEAKKLVQDQRIPTPEYIYRTKKAISPQEIFQQDEVKNAPKKRVVIFGTAGVGKTTFCQMAARKAAKFWPAFKTVFLVKLRNLKKAQDPYEVLADECGFTLDDYQKLLENEKFRRQSLLILDGYDELAVEGEALYNKFKEMFDHILITSRPGPVEIDYKAELEIIGFDPENIPVYIEKYYQALAKSGELQAETSKEKATQLTELIKNNRMLASLGQIPMNLSLICAIFNEDELFFSSDKHFTMTSFYIEAVNWYYKWYQLRPGLSQQAERIIRQRNNPRLDKKTNAIATALEQIAWEAMEKNTLYSSQDALEKILEKNALDIDDLSNMGLLSLDNGEGNFIHLSFQEFFAAQYLAMLFKNENLEDARKAVAEKKFIPRYQLVLSMTAGILSSPSQGDGKALQAYFDALFSEPHDLAISYELNLLAGCFEECQDPTQIRQHSILIEVVTEYITEFARLGIDFRLLDRREKLLNHPKVIATIQHLLDESTTVGEMLTIIERDEIAGQRLAPKLIKSIVSLLAMSRTESSIAAAAALGAVVHQGVPLPKEAVEALIQLLKEGDSYAKINAAVILGKVAQQGIPLSKETVEALVQLLMEDNSYAKCYAAQALGAVAQQGNLFPKKALKALIQALIEGNADAKNSAADALREVAQQEVPFAKEAVDALIQVLKEGDSDAKGSAAYALGAVAQQETLLAKEALKALIQALIEGDSDAKRSAAYALGVVAQQGTLIPEEVLKAIIPFLKESDYDTKRSAAIMLGEVAQQEVPFAKEALDALIETLKEGDSDVKRSAAYALGAVALQETLLAKEALKALIQALIEGDSDAKRSAAITLKEVAQQRIPLPEEAVDALIHLLKEDNSAAKDSAADALRTVALQGVPLPEGAVDALIHLLKEDNPFVKISAVKALLGTVAQQGIPLPEKAIDALIHLLREDNSMVKSSAAAALGAVAQQGAPLPEEAVEALIQFLMEGDSFSNDPPVVAALGAVAQQGTLLPKKAVEALIHLLKKGKPIAKRSAANALGAVAQQGGPIAKKALEALIHPSKEGDSDAKRAATDALRVISKASLLRMNIETIPLIAEVCFFSDSSFFIHNKQFQISDQRTTYPSMVETKLYYEEIRDNLPEMLAKWRKQLDG